MDLAFSAAEQSFAAEVRAWLAAELEPPPAFADAAEEIAWGRAWQARLAADRWVGIQWPSAYGGRDATPVEVALFNMEYARARAPQPVNRVGINLAGPTLLAHGTDEQKARWLPSIL
ncbi:MAG: acyl-CoA dehydrogenase family protein, partial [Acidimicrobiales bacterium]